MTKSPDHDLPNEDEAHAASLLSIELPLTTFERFLWESDGPDSPMIFRVLMRFRGAVDRELLEHSFNTAAARHPLLRAVVSKLDGRPVWSPASNWHRLIWDDPVQLQSSQECGDCVDPIDLTREPGLRVRLADSDDGLLIWLDFHHASCDGMGARQLIADWFHCYDRLSRGETPVLTVFEPGKLQDRGKLRARPGTEPIGFREGLRNFWVTVGGRTVHLRRKRISSNEKQPGASFVHERPFSKSETNDLRRQLKNNGVTINDLGMAVCMQQFSEQFSAVNQKHFVTVLNPVDLRMPSDRYLSATNKTGFTYLRRRRRDCLQMSLTELLSSIREQTTYIKDRYVAAEFVHGLNGADRWPGLLKFMQRIGWFTPTMQFTCLGDTTRGRRYGFRVEGENIKVGQLQVDRITGFAPAAPGVPFSITACETNSRLLLSLRSSQLFVTEQQALKFADRIREGILRWTRSAQGSDTPKSDT